MLLAMTTCRICYYLIQYDIIHTAPADRGADRARQAFEAARLAYGRFPKFHRVFWAETLAH